ncbi:hypothetical protein ACIA5C_17250 [Actinoplanes sp. NPDC051343]|uniref:hypothetical protein n=1 Tax=Actinoplanes sp. NPDC051343 TaxID=3363906 RepID=UPI00379AAE9E
MSWHVDAELLRAYAGGSLTPSRVMAVDAHVTACAECRAAVPVDPEWLDLTWAGVADTIVDRRPSLLTGHRARLLTATPALRWSYFLATAAVLAFAVVAAHIGASQLLFLVFAPILPVLAVATAYGPPADSMHEITSTAPIAGPSLVLRRAAVVVGLAMGMGLIAAAALPGPGWWVAAWLLPAFLLCVGTLALATVLPLVTAAGLLGGLWLLASLVARTSLFVAPAQLGYLAAAVVAIVVLTLRRRHLDPGESR